MLAPRFTAAALSLCAAVAWAPAAHAADPAAPIAATGEHDPSVAASWKVDAGDTQDVWDDEPLPGPTPPPTGTNPSAPAPELPAMTDAPTEDPAVTAERARIVGKGRGLVTAGSVFAGFAVVGLVTTSVFSIRGNTRGAIGSAGVSLLLATTGLALVVPGRKRMRNPERYMKTPRVAVAPVLSREVQGGAITLRF